MILTHEELPESEGPIVSRRTLTDAVYEGLLLRLAEGQWAEGQRLPVVRQLEKEFGTSRVTVLSAMRRAAQKEVIRVRPRHFATVSPGAAELATRLLADLHSQPGKRRIALLWPEHLGPLRFTFGQLLEQDVHPAAAEKDIELEIVNWPHTDQAAFVEKIIRRGFAAAMAFGVNAQMLASLYEFRQRRFPVMTFNRRIPGADVPSILLDEYSAARKIASTLAGLGHRNLCMVYMAFDDRLRAGEQRVDSWIDYLTEAGLLESCAMPVYYLKPREDVDLFAPLFRLSNRPTAVVFGYAHLWDLFVKTRKEFPLKVPEDISFVTFDTVYGSQTPSWCPSLTTISENVRRSAECMMEMLDRILAGELHPKNIRVPMDLHLADSIGPVPV